MIVRVRAAEPADVIAIRAGVAGDSGRLARRARRADVWAALVAAGEADLAPLDGMLAELGRTGHVARIERFPVGHAVALWADETAATRLRAAPGVLDVAVEGRHRLAAARMRSVSIVPPAPAAAGRLGAVGAPEAWRRGITGDGVVIAIFDAGVDWLHPALSSRYRGRDGDHSYDWADFVGYTNRPGDGLGHGTAVAALAVGVDRALAYGVAPSAEWIAVRAFDDQGAAGDAILLRSAEWLMAPTNLKLQEPRPDLAPDVINASWTLENGVDPLFAPILSAWRQLGITAVFAAGNDDSDIGPTGTIRMPAAAADAIAVGAVDDAGRSWRRSLGGPTWDGRIKPDVVAPGVEVYTAGLDSGFDRKDGTSMAAPQVSGAAALMLAAQPDLTPDDVAQILRRTATDAGAAGPDPQYGFGRLAADRSAAAAALSGRVVGRIRGADGPIPLARVTLGQGASSWTAFADASGAFGMAVPAGRWPVAVRASGWRAGPTNPVTVGVEDDVTTAIDIQLEAAPGAALSGTVVDAFGAPLGGARVEAVDTGTDPSAVALAPPPITDAGTVPPAADAPVSAVADPAGRFTLRVPSDTALLRVRAAGHRSITTTVPAASPWHVTLGAAPRILLVDADAWMGDGQRIWPYAARALDTAGYARGDAVDVWTIDAPKDPLPPPADRSPYDIVVWSHLFGSPGSLERLRGDLEVTDWLTAWVAAGRRLLVTGQDIGQWDSGEGSARLAPMFFRDVLGARFVATDAGTNTATGLDFLDGLNIRLASPGAYPKGGRHKPDVVAVAIPEARPILSYRGGDAAGVAVDSPVGRRAYVAFGPESAGDAAALARMFGGLIGWLTPPRLTVRADPAIVRTGGTVDLTVTAAGPRAATDAALRLDRPLWLVVAVEDLPAGWVQAEDGALTWRGRLPADMPAHWTIPATVHALAAGRQSVTATLTAAGAPITATTAVEVAAPRLSSRSTLEVVPARLAVPGPVRVVLKVVNDGTLRAVAPLVRIGQLPVGLRPLTDTLTASLGAAAWLPDPNDGVLWTGDLAPNVTVTIAFEAVVDVTAGEQAVVRATIDTNAVDRAMLSSGVRIGGPVLALAGPMRSAPAVWVAGRAAVLTVPLVNLGRAAAEATVRLALPPGIEPPERPNGRWDATTRMLTLLITVPPGATLMLEVPLVITADATPGARAIRLYADDGLAPPNVWSADFTTDVRRFDLRPSRLVVAPDAVGSGQPTSVTLFVGNFGDAAVDAHAALALPPSLVADERSLRVTGGRVQWDVASVAWDVRIPPAAEDYVAVPDRRTADWPPAPGGSALPAADGAGGRPPVPVGVPAPFFAEVVTRTWVTDDGLIAFAPPVQRPDPALGPAAAGVPAIAVLWRPGRPLGSPRIQRSGDGFAVLWMAPGARPEPVAAASLDQDGTIRLWIAPDAPVSGAIVGLHAADGRTLSMAAAEIVGTPLRLTSPGGWARLALDAVPGASLSANSQLRLNAVLSSEGVGDTSMAATVLVNRLTFDPTELTLSTDAPVPGRPFSAELSVATDGRIAARDADVRIQLPAGVDLVPGSQSPELRIVEDELVWQGRIEPGQVMPFAWQMALRPTVPDGTRLVVLARVRAKDVARTDFYAVATVRQRPAATISKRSARSAARPGELVPWVLRALNTEATSARLTLVDPLPGGLTFEPDSARASLGPAPVWDAATRTLRWTGDVPPGSAIEVTFDTRFAGRTGTWVSNVLEVTSADGTRLTTAAPVLGAAGRVYLPLASSRP